MDNQQGLVYDEKTTVTENSEKFLWFFTNLIYKLHNINPDTSYFFILDNARIHNRDKIGEKINNFHYGYYILPPYSPFLNPIERVFSEQKALVKNFLRQKINN